MRRLVTLLMLSGLIWCRTLPAQPRVRHPLVMTMTATAFTRAHRVTASGTIAHFGIAAADPAILPLGSRIRITGTGTYDGAYLVTDTGNGVKGHRIDLYVPSRAEAKEFGTKKVRVVVTQIGTGKADARNKDGVIPPPPANSHTEPRR
jgi:3D (Asp-Asp-Asp) domain-containing protein